VESGIVQDNRHALAQMGCEEGIKPSIKGFGIAGALKQHGRYQPAFEQRADQTCSRSFVAAARAVDFMSL
jgi:hypothetical protein